MNSSPAEQLGLIDIDSIRDLDERTLGPRQELPLPEILPPPQIVYRGDKRSPDEIEPVGGFLPSSEVAPTDENNGLNLLHAPFRLFTSGW